MTDQTNKLEPCPFCGCADIDIYINISVEENDCASCHEVTCRECDAKMRADTRQLAIAAWNRRASAPAGITLDNAPIGTKAPAIMGGHWCRMERGWKWGGPDGVGGTFPRPGGDWNGRLIAPSASAPAAGSVPSDEEISALWNVCDTPCAANDYTTGPLPFARALLARYGSPAWQLIETAPKNGEVVLVRGHEFGNANLPRFVAVATYVQGEFHNEEGAQVEPDQWMRIDAEN